MKKFEVSYNARNVAIKEAYFGNKVIIKNPNPGAKENAASMARNQELELRNQVKLLSILMDRLPMTDHYGLVPKTSKN